MNISLIYLNVGYMLEESKIYFVISSQKIKANLDLFDYLCKCAYTMYCYIDYKSYLYKYIKMNVSLSVSSSLSCES